MSEQQITGTLHNWYLGKNYGEEYILWGDIRGDIHGRFPDGSWIHTSGIKHSDFPVESLKEGDVVKTRNSTYLLGKRGDDE